MPYLPREILRHIFSHFQLQFEHEGSNEDYEDYVEDEDYVKDQATRQLTLSSVSRVSRRFRQLALPLLYHTIPATSAKLLTVLSSRPQLAELVKAIDLTPANIHPEILDQALSTVYGSGLLDLTFACRLLRTIWDTNHDLKYQGTEVVTFLMLLPNLELLRYESIPASDITVGDFFNGQAGQVRVPNLRKLAITDSDMGFGLLDRNSVQKMLQPTLEELHCISVPCEINPYPFNRTIWPGLALAVHYPNLQKIILSGVEIDGGQMGELLSRTPNLQSLRINWPCPRQLQFNVDLEPVGKALRKYGRNLKELELKHNCDHSEYRFNGCSIGSLQELTKLHTLNIWQDIFIADFESHKDVVLPLDEVLPHSLERLNLFTYLGYWEDTDEQVCRMIQGGWTKLRSIQMGKRFKCEEITVDIAELGWEIEHEEFTMKLTKMEI